MGTNTYNDPKEKLKTFEFVSTTKIIATSEDEAKMIFANNSTDFAANAVCTEITD